MTPTPPATAKTIRLRKTAFWLATGLAAVALAATGAADLARSPQMVAGLAHLGYPAYLATILGMWKLLAAIAIVAPGQSRVKEWAYAGLFFDLTGAAMSHGAMGDSAGHVLAPLVVLGVVAVSYALRPVRETAAVEELRQRQAA